MGVQKVALEPRMSFWQGKVPPGAVAHAWCMPRPFVIRHEHSKGVNTFCRGVFAIIRIFHRHCQCRSGIYRSGSVPHSRVLPQSCARGYWRYIPEPAGMLHAKCWGLNLRSSWVSPANWRCATHAQAILQSRPIYPWL